MMARQPLSEISANSNYKGRIKGRGELTPYWHSHIVGRACGGQTPKTIVDDLRIYLSTIKNTIYRADSCYKNEFLH